MKKIIIFLVILFSANLHATEAFNYAKDSIEIFADINSVTNEKPNTKGEFVVVYSNLMHAFIKQKQSFQNALIKLKPYESSSDEMIRNSASIMEMTLEYKIKIADQGVRNMESILNNPKTITDKTGSVMKQAIELEEDTNKSWGMYIKASTSVQLAISGDNKPLSKMTQTEKNAPISRMKISKKERTQLLSLIKDRFGKEIYIDKKNVSNQAFAASYLFDFLNGPLKSIDE